MTSETGTASMRIFATKGKDWSTVLRLAAAFISSGSARGNEVLRPERSDLDGSKEITKDF